MAYKVFLHNKFWDDGFNYEVILELNDTDYIIQRTIDEETAREYIKKFKENWIAEFGGEN